MHPCYNIILYICIYLCVLLLLTDFIFSFVFIFFLQAEEEALPSDEELQEGT